MPRTASHSTSRAGGQDGNRIVTAPIALVTGGAVGIGRAIAIAVGERGGLLFNIDPDGEQNLETGRLVERTGGRCVSFAENASILKTIQKRKSNSRLRVSWMIKLSNSEIALHK